MSNAKMLDQSTLNCVRRSLISAVSTGYSPVGYTDNKVAADMLSYDVAIYDGWSIKDLEPYVREVRESLTARTKQ